MEQPKEPNSISSLESANNNAAPETSKVIVPETTVQPVTTIEEPKNEKVSLDKLSEQKTTKLYEDETDDDKFFDDFFSDE